VSIIVEPVNISFIASVVQLVWIWCFQKKLSLKLKNIYRYNVKKAIIDNYVFLSAIFYAIENGCKWRALPKEWELAHHIHTF
jgi:hypothetical protein